MEDEKGFGSLEGKVVAFSMKDSNEIKLFFVKHESSTLLNKNGVPLKEVIESENVLEVYFPHPIGAANPIGYWFERFPASTNGSLPNYRLIEEKSQEARELEEYGVKVKSHGELV